MNRWVSQGDEVDAAFAQFFVNSSLAPVLLFRRRLKSVADALKGIKSHGFSRSRWGAVLRYWDAVCRQSPSGLIRYLEPWVHWILLDLLGFYKWVFDALGVLNDLVRQVVVTRRDSGLHRWACWLSEDLGSRPYGWLRPDFVPSSPFLVIKDQEAKTYRTLAEPHLIDAEFRQAWMPYLCKSGHPVVTVEQFLVFVDPFLP